MYKISINYQCPYCGDDQYFDIWSNFEGVMGNICMNCGEQIAYHVSISRHISFAKFEDKKLISSVPKKED